MAILEVLLLMHSLQKVATLTAVTTVRITGFQKEYSSPQSALNLKGSELDPYTSSYELEIDLCGAQINSPLKFNGKK